MSRSCLLLQAWAAVMPAASEMSIRQRGRTLLIPPEDGPLFWRMEVHLRDHASTEPLMVSKPVLFAPFGPAADGEGGLVELDAYSVQTMDIEGVTRQGLAAAYVAMPPLDCLCGDIAKVVQAGSADDLPNIAMLASPALRTPPASLRMRSSGAQRFLHARPVSAGFCAWYQRAACKEQELRESGLLCKYMDSSGKGFPRLG